MYLLTCRTEWKLGIFQAQSQDILSEFLARWLVETYMFDKSRDHENDVMMAKFVFLFLVCAISRETSTEMDVQTVNVIVFFL